MTDKIDKLELSRVVLNIISEHIGEHNRVLRMVLVAEAAQQMERTVDTPGKWAYFDRVVRKSIEQLRVTDKHGAMICSTQEDEGGYFMAETDAELDQHLAVEEARGITILQSVKTRRRLTSMPNPDQMRLELEEVRV